MKVIISHDVDHLSVFEHKRDLVIPKFVIRSFLETAKHMVSCKTLFTRISDLCHNNWNGLDELIEFDKAHGVKSTFFFGMANGLGLAYSIEQAVPWIKKVLAEGFDAGVHGIEFKNVSLMEEEFKRFREISGLDSFGMRMHYLRMTGSMLDKLDQMGYLFDSTEYSDSLKQPYRAGNIVEIPLHIMDTYLFYADAKIQKYGLAHAIEVTKRLLDQADRQDGILNVLFHPNYFSQSWPEWKRWYIWFVEYCVANRLAFANYKEVVELLK